MTQDIPEIEIHLSMMQMPVLPRRKCDICNEKLETGTGTWVGRPVPKWITGEWIYRVWKFLMWNVLRKKLGVICHKSCVPDGWLPFTYEPSTEIDCYWSIDAEEELMKILTDEITRTRND